MRQPASREGATVLATLLALALATTPGATQEPPAVAAKGESDRETPAPKWRADLGLSYLATTGNSNTNSLGFSAHYADKWGLWGLDSTASALRASEDGTTTAENYTTSVRASRDLNERLALTAGLSARKDRLAGIDLRTEADLAMKWTFLDTEAWTTHVLAGPSWVREDPVEGMVDNHLGAIIQIDGEYTISEGASATARATFLPNLEDSSDYRTEAEAGLQAAINRRLALRLTHLWLYDNQPVPGFEKSDTRTTASLVLKFGKPPKKK